VLDCEILYTLAVFDPLAVTASKTKPVASFPAVVASDSISADYLLLTDNTTNNATSSAHGFLPKLSNNAAQFLNGQGNFTTPSGIANAYVAQAFSSVSSVTVTHNFGGYPIVAVIDSAGSEFSPAYYKTSIGVLMLIKTDELLTATPSF